ncbi:alpha/beta fold hydrolase [Magnetospira thiophila]
MPYREGHYLSQDGLRLYYRDYGDPLSDSVPLLCLPGLTRNSRDFDDFARRHMTRRRVVCPDFRGRGRSQYAPLPSDYEPSKTVDDIRHLLSALNLHRVIVVGTSFGGIMAMAMAVALPNCLKAVVLNDVGPEIGATGVSHIIEYLSKDWTEPNWESAAEHMKVVFPRETFPDPEDWLKLAQGTYKEQSDGLLHFDFDRGLRHLLSPGPEGPTDLWPLFRALKRVPVMVVRGGDSLILTAEGLQKMSENHPDLAQVTLPGCGHPPFLNEPLVAESVDAFLAAL